jgi:hypothetical protein
MLILAQNSNKANYKIQDFFANRQIKEDVKCNSSIFERDQKYKNDRYSCHDFRKNNFVSIRFLS